MPEGAAQREWSALLDRFERQLDEGPDAAVGDAWAPAASPLPPELADRARRALAAQHERMARLIDERDDAAAQLAALRLVPAEPERPAAYLDLDG
ncbi:hypothetical protein [Microbacterium marinilacus]|uniref:Uncharacterized protein n=1 Tax=Microbacterium marinilacus TaxID=415209 RepID=A0ABP7B5T7_9MICO|nr:hypothetical protein [Microbacterium marinilacus]MBY0687737.1 hypothetical protein [Microbacterium marinilacus]